MCWRNLVVALILILNGSKAAESGKIAFEECVGQGNSLQVYDGDSSRLNDVGMNVDKFCCQDYLDQFHFGVYSRNQNCCEGAYKPVYNQEAFECVPSTDGERVKQKVVPKKNNVELLVPYYFKRTEPAIWERRNCIIKGQIIVTLNEAADRQAQVPTKIELRLKSKQEKRCTNKLNKHLYYLVDSPQLLTAANESEGGTVEPTIVKSMTPLKSKQAKLVKKLFSSA